MNGLPLRRGENSSHRPRRVLDGGLAVVSQRS